MSERLSFSRDNSTESRRDLADRLTFWYNLIQGDHRSTPSDRTHKVLRPSDPVKLSVNAEPTVDEELDELLKQVTGKQKVDDTEKDATPNKSCIRLKKREVQVFQPEDLELARKKPKSVDKEDQKRLAESLKLAFENNGARTIPVFKNTRAVIQSVRADFHNFSSVLDHLEGELMLAGMGRADRFRVSPLLLDGPPGVGKTAFAQRFAKELKLPYLKLAAGGLQGAFQLTGTASHWGNTHTGEIFNLLALGKLATGIVLLDEVEKISDDGMHPVLPALLDLLEPETAQRFRDESLQIPFDASRLIILMTTNSMDRMNDALLSRAHKFSIGIPAFDQKMRVALNTFSDLNKQVGRNNKLTLDMGALETLANYDISTRGLIQGVRAGFIHALSTNKKIVVPLLVEKDGKGQYPSGRIGFHANLSAPGKGNISSSNRGY